MVTEAYFDFDYEKAESMLDFEEGHITEAEQRLSDLLDSSRRLTSMQRFAGQFSRSTVRRCAGRWTEALEDLNDCDELIGTLPLVMQVPSHIDVYHAKAKLLSAAGSKVYDPNAAIQATGNLRPLAPELADELESELALKTGDWEKCIRCSESALLWFGSDGWLKPVAVLRRRIGEARLGLGQLDRAEVELHTAYNFLEKFGAPDERAYSAISLARLHSLRGDHQQAWQLALRALHDIDSLIRDFRVLQEQQDFLADKLHIYDTAFEVALRCSGTEGTNRAWTIAERAKSFYLCQLLANADVPLFDGVDPELLEKLKQLELEVDRCARSVAASGRSDTKDKETELIRVSKERQQLLSAMMRINPRWAAIKAPTEIDIEGLLGTLPPDWLPVSYFWSSRSGPTFDSYLFFRDSSGRAQFVTVPWTIDEMRALNEIQRLSGQYEPDSPWTIQQFTSKFFPPELTACLRSGLRLLISPDAHNRGLPLHALELNGMGFVFARWPVQYIPTMSLLGVAERPSRADKVLLMGCPETPLNPGRLDGVPEEIEDLNKLWEDKLPGKVDHRVLEPNDSPEQVGLPISRWHEYGVLHFSCHGKFEADNPFDAALFLGEDAVRATELFGVRLRASLAVLSACYLGATSSSTADEWIGMYLPLFYAGVGSVLVSLWEADADTAQRIMLRFHLGVAQGEQAAAALSNALAPQPGIPQLWANWYLVGVPTQNLTGG